MPACKLIGQTRNVRNSANAAIGHWLETGNMSGILNKSALAKAALSPSYAFNANDFSPSAKYYVLLHTVPKFESRSKAKSNELRPDPLRRHWDTKYPDPLSWCSLTWDAGAVLQTVVGMVFWTKESCWSKKPWNALNHPESHFLADWQALVKSPRHKDTFTLDLAAPAV